jgi:hypothetical protein
LSACRSVTLSRGARIEAALEAAAGRLSEDKDDDEPNPIGLSLPDGTNGRVWLASDRDHSKIIGDDRLWRINTEELLRQRERRPRAISWLPTAKTLRRPIIVVGRNDPVRDVDDALRTVKGFQVRLCIEAEKELQVLGCGWRIVTCQFRGNKVLLRRNGSIATMKRKASRHSSLQTSACVGSVQCCDWWSRIRRRW